MKVAVIGSRNLKIENLEQYLPKNTTEIVSGGAKGVDLCAKTYALEQNLKYTEFLPRYDLYRKNAPLKRNLEIINYADFVLAFWDGESRGTKFVIDECEKIGKTCEVVNEEKTNFPVWNF
ncbi:MAG: hypothetical protein R3Y09_04180 [Clostridia bacterium]